MRFIEKFLRIIFIILAILFVHSSAFAQGKESFTLLEVLPAVTFILALTTGMLNLYIMNRLGKTKEDILTIVRAEFKNELSDFEHRMATKEQVEFLKTELKLMLKNIEYKLDSSANRDKRNDDSKHN